MAASKMTLRQRSGMDKASRGTLMSAEASPDSKCPICLDIFNNRSYLDLCLHKFCFRCIHEWSKNKAECPLCKQPFNSIYHSIKSEKDFKKYDLRPTDNGSFGSFGGERFRYRTTLTGVRRQAQRRTSPPPDNGILFEAMADRAPPRQDRGLRRMMTRLAARVRAASEGGTVRNLREEEMVKFRRELYRLGIRVRSVRDGGRSRDTTAAFYLRNPACLHRLVPWLKRELIVLYGAHGSLVNIVQHIIMSRITHQDMEDGAIQEELRPFLQGRTEHFLHEFISFAKAPFNMEAYDRQAVYDCPAPSSNEDSSSNSSVIAISEDEQGSVDLDPPGDSMSSGALSQSAWDDETPGPSYSTTTERSRVLQLSVPDSESDSSVEEQTHGGAASPQHRSPRIKSDSSPGAVNNDGCLSSDDGDCVIVGFVKPVAERTPELVQLSSDSEESVHEVPRLPQHIRFTSVSPTHSREQGSGGSERVEKERNRSGSKEKRIPSMSRRHEPSSRSEKKNRGNHDRDGRRHHSGDGSRERRRSRSRERRRRSINTDHGCSTRSPVISAKMDGTYSPRSSSRERSHSRWEAPDKRRDRELDRSGCNHEARSHSYNWQSYSHYSWDKENSETHYSYYSSCHKNPDRRSLSRSRSCSRESRRQDRTRSRSRSYSSSGSPSTKKKSRHDKPGGKRKYKTRHLEEPSKNASSKSHPECDSSTTCAKEKKKKSKEKRHKKSKEKSGKRSRSLSVEIVYEGSSSEQTKKHHKKKKKHKKKSKRHRSKERTEKHSSSVITIDSDSDNSVNDTVAPASSTNKDSAIKRITGDPVDSTPLESMLQCWENEILEGLDMLKRGSSQTTGTSGSIVEQCDVPHSEDEMSLKDELKGHIPSNANTRIS